MIQTYMWDDIINKSTLLKCVLMAGHEEMINAKMLKAEGSWVCTECDYTSKKNYNVYEHIESKHVKGPEYMCEECNIVCPTRKALRCHIGRYHPKPKVNYY